MDYIELARHLSGNTSSGITRKTATATSASANGTVQINVGGNNITVPTIGNIGKGDTVVYIVQDGMPVAIGSKGAGDTLHDDVDTVSGNVTGLQTLIRETDTGNLEVAKVNDEGKYVGTRTIMTSDAFKVCSANGTSLVSYGKEIAFAEGRMGTISAAHVGTGELAEDQMTLNMSENGVLDANHSIVASAKHANYKAALTLSSENAPAGEYSSAYLPYVYLEAYKSATDYVGIGLYSGGADSARSPLEINTIDTSGTAHKLEITKKGTLLYDSESVATGLADHITQSYTKGDWYVERYASGLVKQYWYGLATFAASVGWVAQQAYPVALSAVYSAQATGSDYRVTQLYAAPMEQSGAACYIGGTASEAHQSNVSLCVIGMAAS